MAKLSDGAMMKLAQRHWLMPALVTDLGREHPPLPGQATKLEENGHLLEIAKMAIRHDGRHLVANLCWEMAHANTTANTCRTVAKNY